MEEKEISTEDVKKEFETLQQAEAEAESSTVKEEVAETSAEDVKTETAEKTDDTVKTEEPEPKVIPYNRFKEVNDKLKNFEELEKEASNLIERGPDGKLRIKVVEKKEPEDDGITLTEEEQLALDSAQTSVVSKIVAREFALRERQNENNRLYREQSSQWWNRAKEEFPEVAKPDSEFYKRADKIFREQYVTFGKNKGEWTAPANAHYLSCLQAEKELAREKVKTSQAKIEEKKGQKQQVFVEKKSGQQTVKKKVEEKEFENLSASDQEDVLREQFESRESGE